MQQCANCGHQNRPGVVFCENCGASLIGKIPLDTKSLGASTEEERALIGIDTDLLTNTSVQGIAVFEEGASLRLDIQGSPDPILFKPKTETIFGRRDPATGAMPDVDLTPFAGYRMGVSRRHAAIRGGETQTLDLWDLGSSNGTFLNGERLNPHRPYRLRDGDEIRLGSMSIRIYFQREEKAPPKPEAPKAAEPVSSSSAESPSSGHTMPAPPQPSPAPERSSAVSPADQPQAEQPVPSSPPAIQRIRPLQEAAGQSKTEPDAPKAESKDDKATPTETSDSAEKSDANSPPKTDSAEH